MDVPGLRNGPESVGAGVVAKLPGWLPAVSGNGLCVCVCACIHDRGGKVKDCITNNGSVRP